MKKIMASLMKKIWEIIKVISAALYRLGKIIWVFSISLIVIGVGSAATPYIAKLAEENHTRFDPVTADWMETILEKLFYNYGPLWFFLTMIITGIVILVYGLRWFMPKQKRKEQG